MPDPADYSDQDAFMAACVPMMIDEGKPQAQAVAACSGMWEDRNKSVGETVTRAYSLLTVKAVEEDQRTIRGVATTPETDRIGDIVESLGIKFKNPLPLLLHHRHDHPVGHAVFDKATDKGITFQAKIPKIGEPGVLKDRLDEAWQSIKAGLIAGVSIGFKPRDWEPLENGGIRFTKSECYELSLVTIPANASATISVIKSLDEEQTAASGQQVPANRPGASGKLPITLKLKERMAMSTVDERIGALEAKRAGNLARMNTLSEEAGKRGETLDDSEADEYKGLEVEMDAIDEQLARERKLEKFNISKATAVNGSSGTVNSVEGAAAMRGGGSVRVSGPNLPPGIRFTRVAKCLAMAQGNRAEAAEIAAQAYSDDYGVQNILKASARMGSSPSSMVLKAAVHAGGTNTWAGFLVGDETNVFAEFLEFLRPMTILGKFGTGGIPALTTVPFRVPILTQTGGGDGYWVGEGAAKPLTSFAGTRTTLEPLKAANIAVLTEEVIRDSSPSAETWVRDQLAKALRARIDTDFIDPGNAGLAGIKPAAITNGVTPIASSGPSADNVRADVAAVMQVFIDNDNIPQRGAWVMSASTALQLGMMRTLTGEAEFGGVGLNGGTFAQLPVIVSEFVGTSGGSPNTRYVWLVDASSILLADEGDVSVDFSREASLQMDTAPTMASIEQGSPSTPVPTSVVSMFQTNSVAFRAERSLNWLKARTYAVQGLSGVTWGT